MSYHLSATGLRAKHWFVMYHNKVHYKLTRMFMTEKYITPYYLSRSSLQTMGRLSEEISYGILPIFIGSTPLRKGLYKALYDVIS
jgi:hypothetical protein